MYESELIEFIKNNIEKINAITHKNPKISKNDEWAQDNDFNNWCDEESKKDNSE